MRQAVPKKPKTSTVIFSFFSKAVGVVLFGATFIIALAMMVSFYSYDPQDPAWSSATDSDVVNNIAGEQGAYFADIMFSAIGYAAWLIPFLLIGFAYQLFLKRKLLTVSLDKVSFRLLGVLITVFSLSALIDLQNGNGGMMGSFIGTELTTLISTIFSIEQATLVYFTKILFAILTFVGFYLVTGRGPIGWADYCGMVILTILGLIGFKKEAKHEFSNAAIPSHNGTIEQDNIDRMLDRDERKQPGFFNKIFAPKEEAKDFDTHEFIEIDESLLTEDEYETNAPIQDNTYNSYNYNPIEEEIQDNRDQSMNDTKNNNTIPPIFRNLQRPTENDPSQESQSSDNLNINSLAPEMEQWDQFIRNPQSDEVTTEKPAESEEKNEKKGIPSIFKNLFKARKRKVTADESENSTKIEPSLAEDALKVQAPITPTSEVPSITTNSAATPQSHGTSDTSFFAQENNGEFAPSALQFSISDDAEEMPLDAIKPDTTQNIDQAYQAPETIQTPMSTPSPKSEAFSEEVVINPVIPTPSTDSKPQSEQSKKFPMAGKLPGLDLLGNPPPVTESYDEGELQALASLIEEQFKNFNIEVRVVNIEPGPVITRFELDLAPGVKIAQINNLNKDIARALSVTSVRIVEIIPGKPYIGLEIPNKKRQIVYFKEGLYADAYRNSKHPLTILLGKDVSGNQVVANLEKMPHLLIAGTTGSGKSVGLNTIILSLLYKAFPEDLRLILIDPKMLELSVYDNIPHLLAPVVTDMKESANALRWAVVEMERRYMLMSKLRVRNITGFNQTVRKAIQEGKPILDPLWDPAREVSDHATAPELKPLPYIVIVIDELADMMMSVGKAVEELIARLTQKARAAGIHLVVATQRPSVDVITGLIKANIPSRIAFQVSSKIDSRTVLDQQGAENLLGHGDMLYFPTGESFPIRVHGAFVDDNEVNRVADFLRLTGDTNYVDDILKDPTEEIPGLSENASGFVPSPEDVEDVLYDEAVKIVLEDQRPTISYVQRKLRIGYQRAARLIETMEEQGIVSAPAANGNREILVKYDQ